MSKIVGISEIVLWMYVDDPDGNEVEFTCRAPAV